MTPASYARQCAVRAVEHHVSDWSLALATSLRILLVEDHPQVRETLARHLRVRGCEVDTAAHGQQGLQCLHENTYDLVVSDANMPVMDGVSFLRHAIALRPALRHRLLLCSATPQTPIPGVAFLLKPFSGTDLWGAIERLLEVRPVGG